MKHLISASSGTPWFLLDIISLQAAASILPQESYVCHGYVLHVFDVFNVQIRNISKDRLLFYVYARTKDVMCCKARYVVET